MFLMAVPLLLVDVAHSLFHDSFGFPFQFPCFLVATGFGQFLDFACPFLRPELEALFAVMPFLAMFAVMLTLAMVICPFAFAVVFAFAFSAAHFLSPDPTCLVAHFLGLLVFALLLQGFDLAAFLVDPFTQLVIVLFDSLAVVSFTVFRDEVTCGYGGKQDADECV